MTEVIYDCIYFGYGGRRRRPDGHVWTVLSQGDTQRAQRTQQKAPCKPRSTEQEVLWILRKSQQRQRLDDTGAAEAVRQQKGTVLRRQMRNQMEKTAGVAKYYPNWHIEAEKARRYGVRPDLIAAHERYLKRKSAQRGRNRS